MAGQISNVVGTLLGVKIITYLLSPEEYGRLALAVTLVSLISINLFGPLSQGLMRFWSISKEKGTLILFKEISKKYINILIICTIAISVLVTTIVIFFVGKQWIFLIWAAFFVGCFTGWTRIRLLILVAARKRKIVAVINSIMSIGKPIIAAIMITLLISDAGAAMVGYLVATLIGVLVAHTYYNKTLTDAVATSHNNIDATEEDYDKLNKEILSFSIPFYIWSVSNWMYQSCDRWALASFHGSDVVGSFSVISFIAMYPLIFFSNFLSNLLMPIAYERAGDFESASPLKNAYKMLIFMSGIYIVCVLVFILLLFYFHHAILLFFSNEKYIEFSYLLPYLAISWALFYFGQVLSGFGMLANQPKKYMPPVIISSVTAVILSFYLSSKLGPVGVVWGLGISSFIYAVWFLAVAFNLIHSPSGINDTSTI